MRALEECGLQYEPKQLEEDVAGVCSFYDTNGDGVIDKIEFVSLACALCPARHEDLTGDQIEALIHHRWGLREGVRESFYRLF